MNINKDDVDLLDTILDFLIEENEITCGHLSLDKKRFQSVNKNDKDIFSEEGFNNNIAVHFEERASVTESKYQVSYKIKSTNKTTLFKAEGGFKKAYEQQEENKKEIEEQKLRIDKQHELTIKQIEDIDKANKKSSISLVLAIVSVLIAILGFYMQYISK